MIERRMTRWPVLASGLATFVVAAPAFAQTCPDLPNPIYGSGGSAVTATMREVAKALRALPDPITVFWHDPGACIGFRYVVDNQGGTLLTDTTSTKVKYWDANGAQSLCDAANIPLDFAHMGNRADFCLEFPDGLPDGFGDFVAPVQSANFITDLRSSQKSISAEALYYIFGLGAEAAGVEPWTDPTKLGLRTRGSFIHQFPAFAIFGDLGKVFYDHPSNPGRRGVAVGTQGESISAVVNGGNSNPEATLAYVSGNAADAAGAQVKTLAYQHFGQECAYWPSSSESAKDKLNVRQGLYALWTPAHFYAPVDAQGSIVSHRAGLDATERGLVAERVAKLVGWFTGAEIEWSGGTVGAPPTTINPPILQRIITAGDVPLCAMQATREGTFGAVSSYAPEEPCFCYYEAIATGNASVCRTCSSSNPCSGTDVCRYGYCEAY